MRSTGDQVMNGEEAQTQVIQGNGRAPSRIDQLALASTSRAVALEILTSADIMKDFFQTRPSAIYSDGLILRECRPKVLKKGHGSTQVIAYTLGFLNESGRRASRVELVAKRYRDGGKGERAFWTMRMLWES